MKTFKALGALLAYPTQGLIDALPELYAVVVDEAIVPRAQRERLKLLLHWMAAQDLLDLEEHYVEWFDRGRATSLHLFEHVHGDSRDRGPAMIDLAQTYEKAGLYLHDGQMPDYLPVVLEFVSTQPAREARAFLAEMAHILNAIHAGLMRRQSAYAGVLGALLELTGEPVQAVALPAEEDLDAAWEEPPVFDGCSAKGQARAGQEQAIRIVRRSGAATQHQGATP